MVNFIIRIIDPRNDRIIFKLLEYFCTFTNCFFALFFFIILISKTQITFAWDVESFSIFLKDVLQV